MQIQGGWAKNPGAEEICERANGRKVRIVQNYIKYDKIRLRIGKKLGNNTKYTQIKDNETDKKFQVWSSRVPQNHLALPRPSECRRGVRRSFCGKLWSVFWLRGESGSWAGDRKQLWQDQRDLDPGFDVSDAVMRDGGATCQIVRRGGRKRLVVENKV